MATTVTFHPRPNTTRPVLTFEITPRSARLGSNTFTARTLTDYRNEKQDSPWRYLWCPGMHSLPLHTDEIEVLLETIAAEAMGIVEVPA